MNQKKAKALRRECQGMPRMEQSILTGRIFRVFRHRKTGQIKRMRVQPTPCYYAAVNHYRNAKKAYRGSIDGAVRAAARKADMCEALGIYRFPKRSSL